MTIKILTLIRNKNKTNKSYDDIHCYVVSIKGGPMSWGGRCMSPQNVKKILKYTYFINFFTQNDTFVPQSNICPF